MTAVAQIVVLQQPMLIGDLLLSGPPLPGITPTIPTVSTLPIEFSGMDKAPKRLHQKLALIGENVAIGWAGRFSTAFDFFAELHEQSTSVQYNEVSFDEHLTRQPASMWDEISLVGYVCNMGTRKVHPFGCSQFAFDSTIFGRVGLLGTGANVLRDILCDETILPSMVGSTSDPLAQALSYALCLSGSLLNTEIANHHCLNTLFGGGYEIAVFAGEKFYKLDEVTYVYWLAKEDGSMITFSTLPVRVFRYSYSKDVLVIRTLETTDQVKRTFRESLTPIPPPHRHLTEREKSHPPEPTLNARWMCHYILLLDKVQPILFCIYRHSSEQWIEFQENGDQIGVLTKPEFQQFAAENISQTLHRLRSK